MASRAAGHLTEGGIAQVLACWLHRPGENWHERAAAWLPAGCDALVLQREVLDPPAHVSLWLADEGLDPGDAGGSYDQRYSSWLDDLAAQRAEGIGFGVVVLRRSGGASTVRIADAAGWSDPMTAARISGWLTRVEQLRGIDEGSGLRATRLLRAPGLRLQQDLAAGGEDGWMQQRARLSAPDGLPEDVAIDPVLTQVLAAVDTGLPLGVLFELVATATGDPALAGRLVPAVRSP